MRILNPALLAQLLIPFAALTLVSCNKDAPDPVEDKKTVVSTNSHPSVNERALNKFDDNEDGALSNSEREKMNKAFVAHFDTDGDNKLNDKEQEIARRRSKVTVVASNPGRITNPEAAAAFLSRFDTNNDGKLSSAEAGETRWKVMSRSDTDKDGLVSAEEWYTTNQRRQSRLAKPQTDRK